MDKYIKTQRRRRYKKLKKLFKARDEARKYIKRRIKVKALDKYFCLEDTENFTVDGLAVIIYEQQKLIFRERPLPPPTTGRQV